MRRSAEVSAWEERRSRAHLTVQRRGSAVALLLLAGAVLMGFQADARGPAWLYVGSALLLAAGMLALYRAQVRSGTDSLRRYTSGDAAGERVDGGVRPDPNTPGPVDLDSVTRGLWSLSPAEWRNVEGVYQGQIMDEPPPGGTRRASIIAGAAVSGAWDTKAASEAAEGSLEELVAARKIPFEPPYLAYRAARDLLLSVPLRRWMRPEDWNLIREPFANVLPAELLG